MSRFQYSETSRYTTPTMDNKKDITSPDKFKLRKKVQKSTSAGKILLI